MSTSRKSKLGRSSGRAATPSNTLLVIVLDVSPLAWGERDVKRTALDRSRAADGKGSARPCLLEEVLDAVQAFGNAVHSTARNVGLLVSAVADNETAVVYPRKNHLAQWLAYPESYTPDIRRLKEDLVTGVSELVARTLAKQQERQKSRLNADPDSRQAAMAAAFSSALCIMNRLFVAAHAGGVSALHHEHYLDRVDDQGVVALMSNKKKGSTATTNAPNYKSAWSPRILLIQASEDRARDYNAVMNCAFACNKNQIVVDGCYLPKSKEESSAFLEQVCDLTGGVYSAPSGMSQIGGCLTEVLFSVFLSPLSIRPVLHLPALNQVDFRARCFETGAMVDTAFVCNQCLSIFHNKPTGLCPTCQAKIVEGNS